MLVRRMILAAAVAGAGLLAVPATPASACVPPNCPGFGTCHINKDWYPGSTGSLIDCYY